MRRGLAAIVGRRVVDVEVHHARTVRRTSAEELTARMLGATFTEVARRGKYLFLSTDRESTVMIHLRMSGQVLIDDVGTARPRHCHVVLSLSPSPGGRTSELRFVDPRTFGEVVAFDTSETEQRLPDIARLGRDPIVDGLTATDLRNVLRRTRRPIKAVLLDQQAIAGIGNIYGDEILHRAGVSPWRAADRVGRAQLLRLHRAMLEVLDEAIECGGSTLGDAQYVGVDGRPGDFQGRHRVYGRSGELCVTCGRSRISSARLGGRTTCWCRSCQR